MVTALYVTFAAVFVVTTAAAVVGRRRGRPFGFGVRGGAWKEAALGVGIGAFVMSVQFAVLAATGAVRITTVQFDAGRTAVGLAVFAADGLADEPVYRVVIL